MKFIPVFLFGLIIGSCSGERSYTFDYMKSVGHEVLHCFFGQWHSSSPDAHGLTRYPPIDLETQLSEVSTISLYFLPDAEVQAKYRELSDAALDVDVASVHAFNVRYLNSHACEVYVAMK